MVDSDISSKKKSANTYTKISRPANRLHSDFCHLQSLGTSTSCFAPRISVLLGSKTHQENNVYGIYQFLVPRSLLATQAIICHNFQSRDSELNV